MTIAVSSQGDTPDAKVNVQFGRCPFFLIVDSDTFECQTKRNPGADLTQGAGTDAAQTVADAGAQVVISGQVGPRAYGALNAMEIKIFLSPSDLSVKEAVERWKEGELEEMSVRRF